MQRRSRKHYTRIFDILSRQDRYMESRLLEILVCPICKSSLHHDRQRMELICKADHLAFPIRDGVPIMLENEAREISESEQDGLPS
jgi:uncharacterized protein YbaR (Trm112 family)